MRVKTSIGEYVIGGIYQHYKGNFYMIDSVAKLHDSHNIFLINYHQCTIDGLYVSIRTNAGTEQEEIVHQPFATHETRWNDMVKIGMEERQRFILINGKAS